MKSIKCRGTCPEIRSHPKRVINIGTTAQTEKSLTNNYKKKFLLGSQPVLEVTSIKYLGFQITHTLYNNEDITIKGGNFYSEFNQIFKKFNGIYQDIKIFLFKQFCIQIYGSKLWFGVCSFKSSI